MGRLLTSNFRNVIKNKGWHSKVESANLERVILRVLISRVLILGEPIWRVLF